MSDDNVINWPSGYASSQRSSASSFPFELAAEIVRLNHPTARPVRADLLSRVLPFADESEVGRFPMPSSAVGLGAVTSGRRPAGDRCIEPDPAGARRGLIALACCFAVGWLLGHRRT